jgi:tRNA 2-thiouridine synthesizing protein E
MAFIIDDREIATTDSGNLENMEDWSSKLASLIAAEEGLELSGRHWDVIIYLRDEYINNGANQPNTRTLVKAMCRCWNDNSISSKTLYDLFPGDPSKQGGRIGGLPESRRKGGY